MVNMNVSASNAKMLLQNLKKLKNQADEIQVESCPMLVFWMMKFLLNFLWFFGFVAEKLA